MEFTQAHTHLNCTDASAHTYTNTHTYIHTYKHTHTLLEAHIHKQAKAGSLCYHVCLSTWKTWLFVLHLSPLLGPSLSSPSLHLSIIITLLGPPLLFYSIPVCLSLLILPPSLPSTAPSLGPYSILLIHYLLLHFPFSNMSFSVSATHFSPPQ